MYIIQWFRDDGSLAGLTGREHSMSDTIDEGGLAQGFLEFAVGHLDRVEGPGESFGRSRMCRQPSSATVSVNVRSGCSAITALRAAHTSPAEKPLPPRGFGAISISTPLCSIPLASQKAPSAQPNHSGRSPLRWIWLDPKWVEPYRGPYGCSLGKI